MASLPSNIHFFERGWLSSNNILLTDATQSVLVDTGYWTHAAQTEALLKHALGDAPLTRIINTHLHSDHCGGNAHLQSIYPHVETLVPPGHAAHVFDWDPAILTYTPTGQHCPQFEATALISAGDTFSIANREWQALAAPGHDPNSIILFCASESLLISADALWDNGFGVVFPELEGIRAFQEVADTLDLIESLQPKIVLPGHGAPFFDVNNALQRARSKLAMYQAQPEKHALYAAKVLLKFKLLEFQQIEIETFLTWAQDSTYLHELHGRHAKQHAFANWILILCESLVKSGAAQREGSLLLNL